MEPDYTDENAQLRQLFLERQKRAAKKQEDEEQPNERPRKIIKVIEYEDEREDEVEHMEIEKSMQNNGKSEKHKQIAREDRIWLNGLIYDKRPSSARKRVISIASLLHQKLGGIHAEPVSPNVQSIMITTFGFEMEVFQPIVQCGVPLFVFNRMSEEKLGGVQKNYQGIKNMTVISPPKQNQGNYGVFHTKLWLIKFKTFLRIVVCTSNNHIYDWSVWQNAFWFHDCPIQNQQVREQKIEDNQQKIQEQGNWGGMHKFNYEQDFKQTLKWVIAEMQPKAYDVLKQMKVDLSNYSFEGIKAILIPSIPGRKKGDQMNLVGIAKIRSIMLRHNKKLLNPKLTCNCTSLGKVDQKIFRQVYESFCPFVKTFSPNSFNLIYPTVQYIQNETCGAAEVLFLIKQNYMKSPFKDHIYYRYQPAENGVKGSIPHLKTIIVEQQGEEDKCILYMGSHNLTRAAWGAYQKQGTQINCNNAELGLLFLDYSKEELKQWLPFKLPPTKYTNKDMPYCRQ